MKLPRRRYWVLLLLLGVVLFCVRLGFDYHLIGLFRGEAYYRGMPTSYWRHVTCHGTETHNPAEWLQRLIRRPLPDRGPTTIFQKDPDAQGVLLQLALDSATDHYVRVRAFTSCSGPALGDYDRTAAARCLTDDDRAIRHAAAHMLLRLNKSNEALDMLLSELPEDLCDTEPTRSDAFWTLRRLPFVYPFVDIAALEKRLQPLLQHANFDVRSLTNELLTIYAESRSPRR